MKVLSVEHLVLVAQVFKLTAEGLTFAVIVATWLWLILRNSAQRDACERDAMLRRSAQ